MMQVCRLFCKTWLHNKQCTCIFVYALNDKITRFKNYVTTLTILLIITCNRIHHFLDIFVNPPFSFLPFSLNTTLHPVEGKPQSVHTEEVYQDVLVKYTITDMKGFLVTDKRHPI